jgi:hypothetical protein
MRQRRQTEDDGRPQPEPRSPWNAAAFAGRCIPPDCVAPRSNVPDILPRRAWSAGRLARLGATRAFHHGLLPIRYTVMRTILFAAAVLLVSSGSLAVRTAPVSARSQRLSRTRCARSGRPTRRTRPRSVPRRSWRGRRLRRGAVATEGRTALRRRTFRPGGAAHHRASAASRQRGRSARPNTRPHTLGAAREPARRRRARGAEAGRDPSAARQPHPGGPEIVLHPAAWAETEWWKKDAVDNLYTLVDG